MEQNRIKERLLKMYRLATDGVDGEKDTAQRLLNENLKKYDLTIEDLIEDTKGEEKVYWFKVKDRYQRKLLCQLYGTFIAKKQTYSTYGLFNKKFEIGFKVTKNQYVELSLMFDFYQNQWKKELEKQKEMIFMAFISKHKISLKSVDVSEMSLEELKKASRICDMMHDMDDVSFNKQIGTGNKELTE